MLAFFVLLHLLLSIKLSSDHHRLMVEALRAKFGDVPVDYLGKSTFGEVLDGFGRLDALLGPLGFAEAVRRLSQLCRQRLFQPETRGRPAIQVLGVLESAGLGFDALWVMGMNDDLWPPPPRPARPSPPEAPPAPPARPRGPARRPPVRGRSGSCGRRHETR